MFAINNIISVMEIRNSYNNIYIAYHSTTLPLYHSTTLPLYHSTTLPLYHSTTLPLYHSTTLPLYHSTTLPLYHSTTLPLYHSTTLTLYPMNNFCDFEAAACSSLCDSDEQRDYCYLFRIEDFPISFINNFTYIITLTV